MNHRMNCKMKQLYAQIRQLEYPQQREEMNTICMSLFRLPLNCVDPVMRAYLHHVPPSKRGVALGGTKGIAGIESRDLMDGMDRIAKESIAEHDARVDHMRSLGLYNGMPVHLVPFADRPCKDVQGEDDQVHTGIAHYPPDYDLLAFTLYHYHWRDCIFDSNHFSIKSPWEKAKWLASHATKDEKLISHSARDLGMSNEEFEEMAKSIGAGLADADEKGVAHPKRGHILMA